MAIVEIAMIGMISSRALTPTSERLHPTPTTPPLDREPRLLSMPWRRGAAVAFSLAILLCSHLTATRAAFACPVTIPNDSLPPPGGGFLGPGSDSTHGNGLLWTILPDDGIARVAESSMKPDGSIVTKFVWWRRVVEQTVQTVNGVVTAETSFAGDLRISGRRLDAPSDPLTATTTPEGVHVGSTIVFPSRGCWEITGTAGDDSMTFTVYMLPPGDPLPNTAVRDEVPWTIWGLALLASAASSVRLRGVISLISSRGDP